MTISIENFIKTIYKQDLLLHADTKLSTIASLLNITNAAATDMARKLASKKLVNYIKYKPIKLTASGEELALKVIRKHRLWESFLYQTLGLSLHEIHREAEYLEHMTSDFLADKIDQYLDNPTLDPHGDPIPGKNGTIEENINQILISNAESGKQYKITRLASSDKDFYEFCEANQIEIGTEIGIEKQFESNKMTAIKIKDNKLVLNDLFANFIFIKPIVQN